jgi:integrase
MEDVKKSNRQGRGGDGLHRKRHGGNWYFYHDRKPNGKPNEVSTGTKDYGEAVTFRKAYIERAKLMPVTLKTTFAEVAQNWKSTQALKNPRTRASYFGDLDNHLLPRLGSNPVLRLTAAHLRNYQSERRNEGGDTTTINHELAVLRIILNRLGLWRGIRKGVKFFPKKESIGRPWRPDEVDAVFAEVKAQHSFWYFEYAETIFHDTGMRHKECRCLRRRNIDLVRGIFSVPRPTTKSPNGVRIFPMTADAQKAAKELLEEAEKRGSTLPEHFVFPATIWVRGKRAFDPTRPITTFGHAWRKTRERAGVDPSLRLHDQRHGLTTDMSAVGVDQERAGEMLGMSEPVRAGIYDHSPAASSADWEKVERLRNERASSARRSEGPDETPADDACLSHGALSHPDYPGASRTGDDLHYDEWV